MVAQVNPQLMIAQAHLRVLGYEDVGAVDGLSGEKSQKALQDFKQKNGLPPDMDLDQTVRIMDRQVARDQRVMPRMERFLNDAIAQDKSGAGLSKDATANMRAVQIILNRNTDYSLGVNGKPDDITREAFNTYKTGIPGPSIHESASLEAPASSLASAFSAAAAPVAAFAEPEAPRMAVPARAVAAAPVSAAPAADPLLENVIKTMVNLADAFGRAVSGEPQVAEAAPSAPRPSIQPRQPQSFGMV